MGEEKEKKHSLLWKLRHRHYRLVVMDHETLEQVGTVTLTLANFYTLVSSLLVAFSALVVALIVFTPLKSYIPGYSGAGDRPVYQLTQQVRDLEAQLSSNDRYLSDFRRMLTEDVQTEKDYVKNAPTSNSDSLRAPSAADFDEF